MQLCEKFKKFKKYQNQQSAVIYNVLDSLKNLIFGLHMKWKKFI